MLLNEALESVLLEVGDIRSQTKTGKDGGESNAVTHVAIVMVRKGNEGRREVARKSKRDGG